MGSYKILIWGWIIYWWRWIFIWGWYYIRNHSA